MEGHTTSATTNEGHEGQSGSGGTVGGRKIGNEGIKVFPYQVGFLISARYPGSGVLNLEPQNRPAMGLSRWRKEVLFIQMMGKMRMEVDNFFWRSAANSMGHF